MSNLYIVGVKELTDKEMKENVGGINPVLIVISIGVGAVAFTGSVSAFWDFWIKLFSKKTEVKEIKYSRKSLLDLH